MEQLKIAYWIASNYNHWLYLNLFGYWTLDLKPDPGLALKPWILKVTDFLNVGPIQVLVSKKEVYKENIFRVIQFMTIDILPNVWTLDWRQYPRSPKFIWFDKIETKLLVTIKGVNEANIINLWANSTMMTCDSFSTLWTLNPQL